MSTPTTLRSPNAPATLRLAVVAFLTAAAFALWPRLSAWEQQQFADQLGEHALRSADASSPAAVRRLARLGLPAVEPLVKLSASQRADVAEAAQNAVADRLAAWEVQYAAEKDAETFARQLDALAQSLERHVGQFGGDSRRWATGLAQKIVVHCGRLPGANAWRALVICDRALASPNLTLVRAEQSLRDQTGPAMPETSEVPAEPEQSPLIAPPPPIVEKVEPRPLPNPTVAESSPAEAPVQPAPAVEAPPAAKASPTDRLNLLRTANEPVAGPLEPQNDLQPTPVVDIPSPPDLRLLARQLRQLTDRELMTRLEEAPRFEAAAARRVLIGRGYSERVLDAAGEIGRLPAPQRLESLERAGALPPAEARLLLRWFVADKDAEVRLKALGLLGTTGDPNLGEIARQRAVEDVDPRVAELATQLMRQVK
jgi:hypothetical protein